MTHPTDRKSLIDSYGIHVGLEQGYFFVRRSNQPVKRHPTFDSVFRDAVLKSRRMQIDGTLASLEYWGIDAIVRVRGGKSPPETIRKEGGDDARVRTQRCQYEAVQSPKGVWIAKQFILGRFHGQNKVLEKYRLDTHNRQFVLWIEDIACGETNEVRRKFHSYEHQLGEHYCDQISSLFPEALRSESGWGTSAHDARKDLFKLAYEMSSWQVHQGLVRAQLDPFLGFYHPIRFGKLSLVSDFQLLYQHVLDDVLIRYCRELNSIDIPAPGVEPAQRNGGISLPDANVRAVVEQLNEWFESGAAIKGASTKQNIESLIGEELTTFVAFLRDECEDWVPSICSST